MRTGTGIRTSHWLIGAGICLFLVLCGVGTAGAGTLDPGPRPLPEGIFGGLALNGPNLPSLYSFNFGNNGFPGFSFSYWGGSSFGFGSFWWPNPNTFDPSEIAEYFRHHPTGDFDGWPSWWHTCPPGTGESRVPEPSLIILLGIGLGVISLAAWRWPGSR